MHEKLGKYFGVEVRGRNEEKKEINNFITCCASLRDWPLNVSLAKTRKIIAHLIYPYWGAHALPFFLPFAG